MNKYRVFITILVLIGVFSFGFSDSMIEDEIKGMSTEEQITYLNSQAEKLYSFENEKAEEYAVKALEISQEQNNQIGTIDAYNNLGYIYIERSDLQNSIVLFKEASVLSSEIEYKKGQALSMNGFGIIWYTIGDYNKSIEYYDDSLVLFDEIGDTKGAAFINNNLGAVYESMGAYDKSVEFYQAAYEIFDALDIKNDKAVTLNNLGSVNMNLDNYENALEYYTVALSINEELGNKKEVAKTINNIGDFFVAIDRFDDALNQYSRALEINQELGLKKEVAEVNLNLGFLFELESDFDSAILQYEDSLSVFEDIEDVEGQVTALNNIGTVYSKIGETELALEYHSEAFARSSEISYRDGLKSSIKNVAIDYQDLGDYEESNYYMTLYLELNDMLIAESIADSFANSEIINETEKKTKEIRRQNEEIKVQEEARKRLMTILTIIGVASVIILFLLVWVVKERGKSEKLLLNILPKKVATDLKKTGKTPPVRFEDVTVYFSDVVGFTNLSSTLDPAYLIGELNDIFTMFDNIMERYNCERIKTIGDAYLAVCGMPAANNNHARNMLNAALEIRDSLIERNKSTEIEWKIRIGIHTGKVVGGVVGIKKYIYDVFGDTINTASRMESNGAPLRVNISRATFDIVKDDYITEAREPIEVKGKGIQEMFFVNGRKEDDLSVID